jgi:hypothetical protein
MCPPSWCRANASITCRFHERSGDFCKLAPPDAAIGSLDEIIGESLRILSIYTASSLRGAAAMGALAAMGKITVNAWRISIK